MSEMTHKEENNVQEVDAKYTHEVESTVTLENLKQPANKHSVLMPQL